MKKILLSISLLLIGIVGFAHNRSQTEMQAIAAAKLNASAVKGLNGGVAQRPTLHCVSDDPAYSVFAPAEGAGFVIVAKSTLADPIIGYSAERFDVGDMPEGLQWYLSEVSRNLQMVEAGRSQAPSRKATFTPVETFITTQWSQEYPFNQKTPNKYPSGCVATALAQVMNYCQYPASAEFDGTYQITKPSGKKTTTETKTEHVSSTYTWPYQDTYKTLGRYGDNIDELMRDCGYAAYMNYASDGSATAGYMAGIALVSVFGYPEESVKQNYFMFFGDQEKWNQIIYDELARRCPIIYGGSDSNYGGHAFIFGGVDVDGLVYVNWGWRGTADGFYSIQHLTPTQGGQNMNFENSHHMVYGIRPNPLPTDHLQGFITSAGVGQYTFHFEMQKDNDGVEHKTLFCNLPNGFVNLNATDFQGAFGLFAQDLTDGTSWVIAEDLQDRDTLPAGYGYSGSEDFAFYYYIDGEKGLKPGHTYRMSFGTKDDREGVWHSIFCEGGELGYDITYTGDIATSTVSAQKTPVPVLTGVSLVPAASTAGNYSDNLTRVYDTSGRLVYTAPTSQFNLWDIPAHGILVVKQGGQSRKVVR